MSIALFYIVCNNTQEYTMRINLNIPDKFLKVIDEYCETKGYKRSNFMVMASLQVIGKTKIVNETQKPPETLNNLHVDNRPMFSDGPSEGYHFSETIGKYIKDEF